MCEPSQNIQVVQRGSESSTLSPGQPAVAAKSYHLPGISLPRPGTFGRLPKQYKDEDWERVKPLIKQLYIDKNLNLNHVNELMKSSHEFNAR
jgi:hypothetical protein